jgi:hypothetical protein
VGCISRKPLREIAIWNCIKATAVVYTPAFLVHRRWKRKSLISENEELGGSEESQELGENEKDVPMVTVGDAIQSFLMRPDGYTKGMCLASQHAKSVDSNSHQK